MPKKPKSDDVEEKDTWSEDQKDHEYYYDDAHGYEQYEPEEDVPEDDTATRRQDDGENRHSTEGAR